MSGIVRISRSDDGFAILTAIGAAALLTVLAIAGFVMAQNNLLQSNLEKDRAQALAVAEAGLDSIVWRIKEDSAFVPSVDASSTSVVTIDDSGEAIVVLESLNSYRVRITSTGHMTAKPDVERSVVTECFHMSLWNFVLGADTYSVQSGGGGATHGHTNVWGPFYVRGDLDMTGDSSIHTGPLFVRDGDLIMGGNANIGEEGEPVQCYVDGFDGRSGWESNFYGTLNSGCPDIYLPEFGESELTQAYNLAAEESDDGKIGSTEATNNEQRLGYDYKVWDNDTIIDGDENLTKDFVIDADTASFADQGLDATDDLFYDGAGTLYVQGTVFVDGDVTFDCNIIYEGRGTIICTGDINFNGRSFNPADYSTYPEDNVVGFATPANITIADGWNAESPPSYSNADFTGAWYAGGQIDIPGNATIRGSILANLMYFNGASINLLTDPNLPMHLPPSLPGGDDDSTIFMTRWHDAGS